MGTVPRFRDQRELCSHVERELGLERCASPGGSKHSLSLNTAQASDKARAGASCVSTARSRGDSHLNHTLGAGNS